ncbi:hypothetical protein [Nocardioides sp. BYT-33-1]|uniref:hypothetical protein n=1 Tax=Nocardioides sp. BYT-33-1 TaxID=3416952 RepID=UPI003F53E372
MIIHAARRPRTPHDYTGEPEIVRWTVEADDYDAGMEQVRGEIPEGWLLRGAHRYVGHAATGPRFKRLSIRSPPCSR